MPHSPHCIAFYCGSANGHNPTYKSAITEIVEQLAVRNVSVVYGGGNIGLMGVLGDAATGTGHPAILLVSLMLFVFGMSGLAVDSRLPTRRDVA